MAEKDKVTHAKVKYVESNEISLLEIDKILEFQDKPPKDKRDFDNKIIYTAINCRDEITENESEIEGVQVIALASKYV